MINTAIFDEAKKQIPNEKSPIIIRAQNDEFNRKILDYGHFDVLIGLELISKKEKPRILDSSFNHILAKLALKNNISIGIDLAVLRKLDKFEKTRALSRTLQNIQICKKAKTKLVAINYTNKISAISLFISLGASTKLAKEAVI